MKDRPSPLYPVSRILPRSVGKSIAAALLGVTWLAWQPAFQLAAQVPSLLSYQGRVSVSGTNFTGTGLFKFALVDAGQPVATRKAAATIQFGTLGRIASVAVTDGGAGYTTEPTVRIIDPQRTGSGASLRAVIGGGQVVAVTVVNSGQFYSAETYLDIAAPPPQTSYVTFWSNDGASVAGSEPMAAVPLPVNQSLFTVFLGDPTLTNMNALPTSVFTNANARLRIWFNDGSQGSVKLAPDQPLGAAAYAMMAADIQSGAITSRHIAEGSIQTGLLAPGAVGSAQIASGAVQGTHLASQAVGAAHLAPGSVTGAHLAAEAVNSSHLQAGSVQNGHLAAGTIQGDRIASGTIASNHIAPGAIHQVHLAPDALFTNATSQFGFVPPGGIILSPSATPPQAGYTLAGAMDSGSGDAWRAGTLTGAPVGAFQPAVVWTGSELLTWSGFKGSSGYSDQGARYNPISDTWQSISTTGAPEPRQDPAAVWTGTEMIVWGGKPSSYATNNGAIYKVSTDSWRPMTMANAPGPMASPMAVWTGSGMLVWGRELWGFPVTNRTMACALYNPTANTWTKFSTNGSPVFRDETACVWTGTELIIWGGALDMVSGVYTNDGARFRPSDNTWRPLPQAGALSARYGHTAVWTGSRMIVWGGRVYSVKFNDGAIYNPTTDTWSPMSVANAPEARGAHVAVWNGSRMIVWGGTYALDNYFRTGGIYDLATDSWLPTATSGAPAGRRDADAFWGGGRLLIYSGSTGGYPPEVQTYDPTKGLFFMYRWQ